MDHYQTLGINKNATIDEIKVAYRRLASKHHPDKGGDTATFQKIEEAYRILSDPDSRQKYDNPPSHHQQFGGFGFDVPGFDLNSIFGAMFGQNNSQPRQPVFRTGVNITLRDAYTGSRQSLKLQTQSGQKLITVDIPKGVKNGDQLRYDNVIEGGVLVIEYRVVPDLKWDRRGNDLISNHNISVLDLIAGTRFLFTTISGKTLEVVVKPKTQPHTQLKIPGQGMPILNTADYGDQIIVLYPYMPDNIDDTIIQSINKFRNN